MIDRDKFKDILGKHSYIDIICHANPDADALGSMFTLGKILREKYQKNINLVCVDRIPVELENYFKLHLLNQNLHSQSSLVIVVDCSEIERTGLFKADFVNKIIVNIDHHSSNDLFGKYNFVSTVSSVSEIIYSYCDEEKFEIDLEMANWIGLGVLFDTGGLKHDNTTSSVYRIIRNLTSIGIDVKRLNNILFNQMSYKDLITFGRVLNRMKFNENEVLSSTINSEEIQEIGACENQVKKVVDYMDQVDGKKLAIFGLQKDNKIKFSMRSNGSEKIDLAKIAHLFEGGGHSKAAGFSIED